MTRQEIVDIVNSDKKGFYIGTRMILPFKCNLIKLIADSHIFTEFVGNDHVKISQTNLNTSIYHCMARICDSIIHTVSNNERKCNLYAPWYVRCTIRIYASFCFTT